MNNMQRSGSESLCVFGGLHRKCLCVLWGCTESVCVYWEGGEAAQKMFVCIVGLHRKCLCVMGEGRLHRKCLALNLKALKYKTQLRTEMDEKGKDQSSSF